MLSTYAFAPVALGGSVSNILVVHPDNPAKTIADVVAQARVKPGEMTYSSGGTGTSQHMSTVLFERDAGIKLQHVPYRAAPAAVKNTMTSRQNWMLACSVARCAAVNADGPDPRRAV